MKKRRTKEGAGWPAREADAFLHEKEGSGRPRMVEAKSKEK